VGQYLTVEKHQGAGRLVLGGSRNTAGRCQIGKKLAYVIGTKVARMLVRMKDDKLADPADIGPFGMQAEMPQAAGLAHLIEEFRLGRGSRH